MAWERLVFAGFETQAAQEFLSISVAGANPSVSGNAHTGDYALSSPGLAVAGILLRAFRSRVRFGFAMRHSGNDGTSQGPRLFSIISPAGVTIAHVRLRVNDGVLELFVNGVSRDEEAAGVSGFASEDTYHQVSVQANIVDDASGYISIYVNDAKRLEYLGAITGDVMALLYLGGTTGGSASWSVGVRYDDVYVDGSEEVEPDEIPPNLRFEYKDMTGDGASSDWTVEGAANNYQAISDGGPPDGDATYVWSVTNGNRDLYAFGGYTAPEGYAIDAVLPVYIGRKTAAGSPMQIESVVHDGTALAKQAAVELSSAYGFSWARYAEKPSGGVWGVSVAASAAVGQDAVVP